MTTAASGVSDDPWPSRRSGALLLTPIVPAPTGNGAAMRAGMHLKALARDFDVTVVVVPVLGGSTDTGWCRSLARRVVLLADVAEPELRSGLARLLGDSRWRERLAAAEPLPELARRASPALAAALRDAVGAPGAVPLHVFRTYLAPLGCALAEALGSQWVSLDADDDDAAYLRARGEGLEARAYERLLDAFGRSFAWVSAAAPDDAARIGERHGLAVEVVPNAVDLPAPARRGGARERRAAGGSVSLLFVGNLTYAPNVEAALALARDVLPQLRQHVPDPVELALVGRFDPGSGLGALAGLPGVRLPGYVDDLAPWYRDASVVVCPLAHASGTRIKLLEAFAYGVPVVASPTAAAGLGARDGEELLLAASARDTAVAVARLVADPDLGERLAANAAVLVTLSFSTDVVTGRLAALFAATDRAARLG